jgi:hypothetical protein
MDEDSLLMAFCSDATEKVEQMRKKLKFEEQRSGFARPCTPSEALLMLIYAELVALNENMEGRCT